jgi:hypothetical protein
MILLNDLFLRQKSIINRANAAVLKKKKSLDLLTSQTFIIKQRPLSRPQYTPRAFLKLYIPADSTGRNNR